jgi:hypothetical protein
VEQRDSGSEASVVRAVAIAETLRVVTPAEPGCA